MSEKRVRQQIGEASLPRQELDSRLREWQDSAQSKAGGDTEEYCAQFLGPIYRGDQQ